MEVKQKLAVYMTDRGITVGMMAKMANVSVSTVRFWLYGTSIPSPRNAIKLAKMSRGVIKAEDWGYYINSRGKAKKQPKEEVLDGSQL